MKRKLKRVFFITCIVFLLPFFVIYFYPSTPLPPNTKIDGIVVFKSKRLMKVYADGKMIKSYNISLGGQAKGQKIREGDSKTPEGNYRINGRNDQSTCYKNLGISYPNFNQQCIARKNNVSPGGDIKIHGLLNGYGWIGNFHTFHDWTAGCIAVNNDEMDELYNSVDMNTPIKILP